MFFFIFLTVLLNVFIILSKQLDMIDTLHKSYKTHFGQATGPGHLINNDLLIVSNYIKS